MRSAKLIGMVTLRQLRYLTSLARHRHFGRAAGDCAVTQPALSMQIRELERDLGVDLIERRPGDIALTEIGVEVAERAGRILTDVQDLADFARHRNRILAGTLRLGIIPSLAPYVLPLVLPALQKEYPDLRLDVRETLTRQLTEELERGEVDAIMLALPFEHPGTESVHLFEDPFLLAIAAAEAPSGAPRLRADTLDSRRLILLEEGHCLRDQALAFCSLARSGVPASLGATSLATVMQMVANGYGITLVPEVAAQMEVRDTRIKLLRFQSPQPTRRIGLAWRTTSPRKKDFMVLAKIVTKAVKAGGTKRPRRRKAAA
jgi:LysR family hydrogen peroxide-inducible transcriptional activator